MPVIAAPARCFSTRILSAHALYLPVRWRGAPLRRLNRWPGRIGHCPRFRRRSCAMVQRNALKVWEERVDFQEQLLADDAVVEALGEDGIKEKFDMGYHTKHVDTIFKRVFGEG